MIRISVLTPSYQNGPFLRRCIESVIAQEYPFTEHIIVDGGSTDETVEILSSYPQLKWISEPDRGQSDAMNKAFQLSSGDWIVYLNADDYFHPGTFHLINELAQSGKPDMIVGSLLIITPTKTLIRPPTSRYLDVVCYWTHKFPANPVSYFYRRDIQDSIGQFPVEEHYTMDYFFLLRAFRKAKKIITSQHIFGTFDSHLQTKTRNSDVNNNLQRQFIQFFHQLPLYERVVLKLRIKLEQL